MQQTTTSPFIGEWFLAIYLMGESKKGCRPSSSSGHWGSALLKTAWHLCHRIREAMANDQLEGPTLLGVVEVD